MKKNQIYSKYSVGKAFILTIMLCDICKLFSLFQNWLLTDSALFVLQVNLLMHFLSPPDGEAVRVWMRWRSGVMKIWCLLWIWIPYFHAEVFRGIPILTHWGWDIMATIYQTFSNAFSWIKMWKYWLGFHWSLFLKVRLTIFQHWFKYWLDAFQETSHYLNQWWLVNWHIHAHSASVG